MSIPCHESYMEMEGETNMELLRALAQGGVVLFDKVPTDLILR